MDKDELKNRLAAMDIDALEAMTADLISGKVESDDEMLQVHALIELGSRLKTSKFSAFCDKYNVQPPK